MICLFAKQERWQDEPSQSSEKIKRTNSNLENLEQRNTAEHSGTKKSMPEDAQVSLAIMVKLCLRWRFSMDSKEIRDLVQAYVKANKKLEGAVGNHLRKYCRDRGSVSGIFLGIGICISALVFF